MPRPQRIRDREAGAQTAAPELLEVEPPTVDNGEVEQQSSRTGPVSEGELDLSRSVARRLGWVPQEEWTRDPTKWTDAPEFLERTPREIETLKERLRRTGQVADAQAEAARREALAQARAEHDAAVRTGDVEAAGKAVDRIAQNSGPPPQTVAWMGRNPWFKTDPEAQAVAVAAIGRATQAGASIEEQLQAGEAAVRRRYPEHFGDVRQEALQREARLSEVRAPPAVTGGSRAPLRPTNKEKGWTDIPSGDRSHMVQFVNKAVRRGQTEAQAQSFLAAAYWREKA